MPSQQWGRDPTKWGWRAVWLGPAPLELEKWVWRQRMEVGTGGRMGRRVRSGGQGGGEGGVEEEGGGRGRGGVGGGVGEGEQYEICGKNLK